MLYRWIVGLTVVQGAICTPTIFLTATKRPAVMIHYRTFTLKVLLTMSPKNSCRNKRVKGHEVPFFATILWYFYGFMSC